MSFFKEEIKQEDIIKKYFSNREKVISLKEGEVLLKQFAQNNKLYFLKKGKICGYLVDKDLHEPVFEANAGSFVGVYSYFSDDRTSYSQLIAEEDSEVWYYDDYPFDMPAEDVREFLTYLFHMVVTELRVRQLYAGEMAHERQETLKKLIQTEKMATLGQMAAGIAHELNNSVGALSSNLKQVQEEFLNYLKSNGDKDAVKYFEKGLNEGQELTSSEARKARSELEKLDFLNKSTIKTLSRAGIGAREVKAVVGKDKTAAKKIASFWEMGYLLHDMEIAAKQSTHVIQSVKNVGVQKRRWTKNANINKTVIEALAILRSIVKDISVELKLDVKLPPTEACTGEIIQIWINLIKNAVESLENHGTKNPKVRITSKLSGNRIKISVVDNGPGIPKDISKKIFNPNFTTKVGGLSFGLGLGLTIVERIIDDHNGEIKLTSKPGSTRFDIFLPVVD